MKCQILFSRKNKKNMNLSSVELAQRVIKVKAAITTAADNILKYHFFLLLSYSGKIQLGIFSESPA